ncbi:hypothetical protein Mal4_48630 [Maioricimonas rarisocia]|uniref:Uncharacterized protein n=1 Tax=Maioricimonas rarisocia TaxID=2528026 RepID=A0A517ZDG3_9PLAN|nr:hypothetical protein [Maioricimonas rarisocia]QDU40505.1 hypothetical protein Mal4_48630 [Maioricimonas rarisocia]
MQPRCPTTGVLVLLAAGISLVSSSGCSVLKLAVHRLHEEASFRHSNKRIEKRTEKWAEEAFCQQYGGNEACFDNVHFHDGYIAGFKSHVLTGSSELPVFPPEKYRKAEFATPTGKYHVDTWYLGYQNGIGAAVTGGYRELVILRTPGSAGAEAPFPVGVGPAPLPPVIGSPFGPPPLPPTILEGEPTPAPQVPPVPPAPESPDVPLEEPTEAAEPLRLPEIQQTAAATSQATPEVVTPAASLQPDPMPPALPAEAEQRPDAAAGRASVPAAPQSPELPQDLQDLVGKLRPRRVKQPAEPRSDRTEHVIIWEEPVDGKAPATVPSSVTTILDPIAPELEPGMPVDAWTTIDPFMSEPDITGDLSPDSAGKRADDTDTP